jgi:hypothetical protein
MALSHRSHRPLKLVVDACQTGALETSAAKCTPRLVARPSPGHSLNRSQVREADRKRCHRPLFGRSTSARLCDSVAADRAPCHATSTRGYHPPIGTCIHCHANHPPGLRLLSASAQHRLVAERPDRCRVVDACVRLARRAAAVHRRAGHRCHGAGPGAGGASGGVRALAGRSRQDVPAAQVAGHHGTRGVPRTLAAGRGAVAAGGTGVGARPCLPACCTDLPALEWLQQALRGAAWPWWWRVGVLWPC